MLKNPSLSLQGDCREFQRPFGGFWRNPLAGAG
jgi:hypothetical protein